MGEGDTPVFGPGETWYGYQLATDTIGAAEALLPDTPPGLEDAHRALWLSGPPSETPAHTDAWVHNVFLQVAGRKTVWLWPPQMAAALRIRPYGEAFSRQSSTALDGESALPPGAEVTLDAGDALSIPEGWIHQVRTDTPSVSVSFWRTTRDELASGLATVVGALRSAPPEVRALYLHLLRWPPSALDEGAR